MCGDEAMDVAYAVLRIIRGVRASLSVKNATHKRSFKRPIGPDLIASVEPQEGALKQVRAPAPQGLLAR